MRRDFLLNVLRLHRDVTGTNDLDYEALSVPCSSGSAHAVEMWLSAETVQADDLSRLGRASIPPVLLPLRVIRQHVVSLFHFQKLSSIAALLVGVVQQRQATVGLLHVL